MTDSIVVPDEVFLRMTRLRGLLMRGTDLKAIAKECRELSTELELLVNPEHPLNHIDP